MNLEHGRCDQGVQCPMTTSHQHLHGADSAMFNDLFRVRVTDDVSAILEAAAFETAPRAWWNVSAQQCIINQLINYALF